MMVGAALRAGMERSTGVGAVLGDLLWSGQELQPGLERQGGDQLVAATGLVGGETVAGAEQAEEDAAVVDEVGDEEGKPAGA